MPVGMIVDEADVAWSKVVLAALLYRLSQEFGSVEGEC